MRRAFPWLTGSTGRPLALTLLVAIAWAAWWLWPVTPVASWAVSTDEASLRVSSPDGRTLATAPLKVEETAKVWQSLGNVGPVSLRDLTTGRERMRLGDERLTVVNLAFSPDGSLLVCQDRQGGLRVWDAATGRTVAELTASSDPDERPRPPNAARKNFTLAPDGRTLAFERPDCRGYALWDAATGTVRVLDDARRPAAFAPDGRTLAVGTAGPAAQLWDVATGRLLATLGGHTAPVGALAFAPGGRTLATGLQAWDNPAGRKAHTEVKVWSVPGGEALAEIPVDGQPHWVAAFSPDGRWLMTPEGQGGWKVWDVTTVPPHLLDLWPAAPRGTAPTQPGMLPTISRDGTRVLILGDEPGTVRLLDARTRGVVATLRTPSVTGWDDEVWYAMFLSEDRLVQVVKRGETTFWPETPRGFLNRLLRRNGMSVHMEGVWLFDAATGRGPVELPRDRFWQHWLPDPDGRGLWSASFPVESLSTAPRAPLRFELWPVPAGPPWRMWALTASAVALAVADRRRQRRRSLSSAVAS